MDITLLKRFPSSFLLRFAIAFRGMNNCKTLLNAFAVSIQSFITHVSISSNKSRTTSTSTDLQEITQLEKLVTLADINIVMGRLGLQPCCSLNDGIDILSVFDDEEPSLDEVKVAFDVFDENSDGFIDEVELQRILHKFGQLEKANLEQCRNMIKGFDVNGDGVIDFDEFVKLMETCYF